MAFPLTECVVSVASVAVQVPESPAAALADERTAPISVAIIEDHREFRDYLTALISGTEGHATVVDNHLYYRSKKVPGSDSKEALTNFPKAPRAPMHQFLDALAGSKDQPLVTPREAAARVVVMEAIYQAARGHKWVNLA